MDVYLDEQLLPPAAGAETVGDLLARLRRDDPDRLVVAIHLNGREIIGQGIDSLRQTPLNAPGRLEMQSSSARSLAAAALGQAAETLEQSRCCHTRVAELIAAGKSAKAMDELNECFTATPGSRCSWASRTPCSPRPSEPAASRAAHLTRRAPGGYTRRWWLNLPSGVIPPVDTADTQPRPEPPLSPTWLNGRAQLS